MFQIKMLPSSPTDVSCLSSGLNLIGRAARARAEVDFRPYPQGTQQHVDSLFPSICLMPTQVFRFGEGRYTDFTHGSAAMLAFHFDGVYCPLVFLSLGRRQIEFIIWALVKSVLN